MKKIKFFSLNPCAVTVCLKSIVILLLLLSFSYGAFSQKSISLNFEKEPLKKALKTIEDKTGYRFIYSNDNVPLNKPVTFKVNNADFSDVLAKLFADTNISYRFMDNHIIALFNNNKTKANTDTIIQKQQNENGNENLYIGTVVDKTNNPLSGTTVKLMGNKEYTTVTNSAGQFAFSNIPEGIYTIRISYIGYITYETKVSTANNDGGQTFVMSANQNSLDEVVVVGYGESKRRDIVGSVSQITAKDIEKQPVYNLLSSLQGLAPGLEITNTSGTPGSDVSVRIRGINSINGGSPLILIDNVPGDLSSIAPSDVESVEILKDASSTAIYGARGSNGVILVTTKRGKTGKPKLDIQAYTSITDPTKLAPVLNTDQYRMLRKEGYKNDNISYDAITAPDLFMDSSVNTNWGKDLYKSALAQNYQFNFMGGNKDISYYFSGGYFDQDAIIKGDWYNTRYNLRTGVDVHLSKRFTAGAGLAYTYTKSSMYSSSVAATIYYALPVIPYLDAGGNTNLNVYSPYTNPNRQLTSYNNATGHQLLGNLYFDYNIWDKLSFRTDVDFSNQSGNTVSFSPTTSQPINNGYNSGTYGFSDGTTLNIEPKLNYEKNIGKYYFKLLAGATYMNTLSKNTSIMTYTTSNAIDNLNTISNGSDAYRSYTEEPYKFASLFGRLNYKYNNRYMLEGVVRRDGSSHFGPDNKYGTFWSVGGGYILSEEPFMKEFLGNDIFIKLRSSYGTTGTDAIGSFRYVANSPVTSTSYMGNTTIYVGNLANPSLKWEETKKFDVGLDLSLFKNRISLTADYYKSRTNNMLYPDYLSMVTGFTAITTNMEGEVDNDGFEFNLNVAPVTSKNFNWTSSFNISIIKNKLVSLPALANATYGSAYIYKVGSPLDLIWGFKYQGIDLQTGLAKFDDVDKNGGISSYTPDWQVIGKAIPDFFGGWNNTITYKNFDLTAFAQFVKGVDKQYNVFSGIGDVYNLPVSALNRWQKPGDITDIPRAAAPGTSAATLNNDINQSSFAYSDASYIRIKNITLGYNIPVNGIKKIGISGIKLYVTCYNLFTISGFKGDDPEGYSFEVPVLKTYTFGANITF